jgi:hypothetical protein
MRLQAAERSDSDQLPRYLLDVDGHFSLRRPNRGVARGWRDVWDDPDDHA